MPRERIIHWKPGAAPAKPDIEALLNEYLGEGEAVVSWEKDRFFATFNSMAEVNEMNEGDRTRWFEVWTDLESTYVMTRMQDAFTRAVSDRFALLLASRRNGRVE